MDIKECVEKKLERVRVSWWNSSSCYIKIYYSKNENTVLPWARLFDEILQPVLGIPVGSQEFFYTELKGLDLEEYCGEISTCEKDYKIENL